MAAPATHIILAKKVFEIYCPDKNEADFFRGTEFADIRYIANIDRGLTHFQKVSLEEITSSDAFTAGLKTHSLADLTRSHFVNNSGINDWQKYISFFNNLSDLELTFGIDTKTIWYWHEIIKESLSKKPTEESTIYFLSKKLNLPDSENEIRLIYQQLQQIEKIKEVIAEYTTQFENIIKSNLA